MQTIIQLKEAFKGDIIVPGDAGYDEASKVLVRKGSPALVAKVATPEDVASAIAYAREHSLTISVKSGGHSNAGLSTNDDGIIIDVSKMSKVTVLDKATGRVRIGAGAHWGDAAKELDTYGLAISSGDTQTVGVSGLALGGGVGWMVRKYGLAIDSLQSVDLVTANGEQVTASADSNPELFWALRGGSGNFGVATAFEFIAHPTSGVFYGPLMFAPKDKAAWLTGWRDAMRAAPPELTTMAILVPANAMGENPEMCIVQCCYEGSDESAANAVLAPLRSLDTVVNDAVAKKHYYEVLEEAHVPEGVHSEVNNAFFDDFTDEVIRKVVVSFQQGNIFQLRSVGGAMNQVASDATAFAHRSSEVLVVAPQFFPIDTPEEQIQQGLKAWRDIAITSTGAYTGFFSRATEKEIMAAYPPATYKRLAEIKHTYDPQNIFNQNLNIKPEA